MKQLLFLCMLMGAAVTVQAQPWDSVTTTRDMIFSRTEVAPAFAGGEEAWEAFVAENRTNKVVKKAPAGEYKVVVQFIVQKDGSLTDVQALTRHGYGMEKEAVRLIKNTPKWIPAKQNGHIVTCYHRQAVLFTVE